MRWAKHVFLIAAVGVVAFVLVPGAALAQPTNDTWPGTAITALPFTTSEDTTQATIDATDVAAAQACGLWSGTFTNSVWFAYTAPSDQVLTFNTGGSSYSVAYAVLTGTPSSFSAVSCGTNYTSYFQATQGTTYYIGLAAYGGGTGGTLNFSLAVSTPPNPVLTFSPGAFDRSGAATVSGTATCSAGSFVALYGTLTQHVGRLITVSGSGSPVDPIVCDGTPHPWSFTVTPVSGVFKGGPATASVDLYAYNGPYFDYRHVTQTIQLKH